MGGSRHKRRRRDGQLTPLELLLNDPGTVHAAVDAFALAERPDASAWPFVASVGPRTVTLRWAGGASAVPEPEAPWRAGHDARVWIADRAEIGAGGRVAAVAAGVAALVIGQFEETVVFVNTSRAPGPVAVGGGDDGESGLLRELIRRQTLVIDQDVRGGDGAADGGRRGAWWPVEVEGDAIVLLGLAIARMFTVDEAQMACELMQRTAAEERQRQPVAVGHELKAAGDAEKSGPAEYVEKWRKLGYVEEETETPHAVGHPQAADDGLTDWLRQVKEAAASTNAPVRQDARKSAPEQSRIDVPATTTTAMDAGAAASVPSPTTAPGYVPAPPMPAVSAASTPQPSSTPSPTPTPTPVPNPVPAPNSSPARTRDDLDDWAAGFAVSSAEESARR